MKRVVMIAVIMAVITSLFAFSVYAAPAMGASYTASISSDDNNITAYAYAVYEEGVYQTSSTGTNLSLPSLLISVRIVNNTDKWVIKDTDQFKLRLNGNSGVGYPFECIDLVNCQITEIATSSGKVDFTIKGDNSFILAPNETYVLSFRFVNSAGFTTSPSLQFFNNQFLNSAYSIEELVTLPDDELAYISSLNVSLRDIIDVVTYNGNFYEYVGAAGTSTVLSKYFNTYIRGYANIFYGTPYLISVNQLVDGNTDSNVVNGTMRYPVMIRSFVYNNSASQDKATTDVYNEISNFVTPGYVFNIEYFSSEVYETVGVTVDGHLRFYPKNTDSNYQWILTSKHYYNTMLIGYVDVPINISYSWTTPNINSFFTGTVTNVSSYNPPSVYAILRDLYLSITKKEADDNTEEAQEMNDDIHDAEQVWYDNNSQALEEVGLSNYRFNSSQSNGITQAVTQFQAVWNALGDWTNVYIFILILSISTYIIRHEPTTRVKQYRSSVQAERAERISYYGHKNAESRASASTGSTLKNAIRRRK